MKKFLLIPSLLTATLLCGANLLENGSFETPATKKSDRTWRHFPAENWMIYLDGADSKFEVTSNGAYNGSKAVKLISTGKGMVTLSNEKIIPASTGDQVYFDLMARGQGKTYIRIYWYGKDGKRQKKYFIKGFYVKDDWQKFSVTEKVPADAAGFTVSMDILRTKSEIEFDAAECRIVTKAQFDAAAAQIPENSGFEIPADKISNRNWQHFPAKGWKSYAHPKNDCHCQVMTQGAFAGSRAIRLICRDKKSIASLTAEKAIPVKPGDRIFAECMIRGKGKAYIRIYWYDKNGKKLPKYFLDSRNATDKWQEFKTNVKVPEGAVSFEFNLELIANIAEVEFDNAKCRIDRGAVLDNGKIKAVLNPGIGGGIDSLRISGKTMDFTQPNRIGNPGGLFNVLLPANRNPGEIRFAPAAAEVIKPGQLIKMTQRVDSGKYAGIEVVRLFELLPGSSRIKVTVTVSNRSNKKIETSFRLPPAVSPGRHRIGSRFFTRPANRSMV